MSITTELLQQCEHLVPIKSLRKQHLLALLSKAVIKTVGEDQAIFELDQKSSDFLFILKGEVELKHKDGRVRTLQALSHQLPIVQFRTEEFAAQALSECQLLSVERELLDSLLTWSQVADYLEVEIAYRRELDDDADWMQTVLNSNLFYKIPPLNISEIFTSLKPRHVEKGEVIIRQGDHGDRCYFIKYGSAVVTVEQDGEEREVARVGVGRCFGEDALINNAPRNASVTMLEEGMLMELEKELFTRLLEQPSIASLQTDALIDDGKSKDYTWLDVRTQQEFQYRHIKGSVHIPLDILRLKVRMLDPQKHYRVYCNTGSRSIAAAFLMEQKGFCVSVLKNGLMDLTLEQIDNLLVSGEQVFDKKRSGKIIEG